jgi:hypothetical protein
LAVADGAGEAALAFKADPVLTVGAPCCAAGDWAAAFILRPNAAARLVIRIVFFMKFLLLTIFLKMIVPTNLARAEQASRSGAPCR